MQNAAKTSQKYPYVLANWAVRQFQMSINQMPLIAK